MYANVQRCEKLSWKNSLSKLRIKQTKCSPIIEGQTIGLLKTNYL